MLCTLEKFRVVGGCWDMPGNRGVICTASTEEISAADPTQPRGWAFVLRESLPADFDDLGGVVLCQGDLREEKPCDRTQRIVSRLLGRKFQGDTLLCAMRRLLRPERALWLGGLKWSGPTQISPLLIYRLASILRDARNQTVAGLSRDRHGFVDWHHHRKLADWICEEYAGLNPQRKAEFFDLIRPRQWPKCETLWPHETTITDDFDTTDSGTVGHLLTWTEVAGAWDNTSNRCVNSSGAGTTSTIRAESDLSGVDHTSQATVTQLQSATSRYAAAACRFAAAANTFYMTRIESNSTPANSSCRIAKHVTGTTTLLGTGTTVSTGSLPTAVKVGVTSVSTATLTSTWGGVDQETITDSSISTGTRCGMLAMSGGVTKTIFDDFTASDLAAGQPTIRRMGMSDYCGVSEIGHQGVRMF